MKFGDIMRRVLDPRSPINAIKGAVQATGRGDFKGAMKAATLGSLSGGAAGNVNEVGRGAYVPTSADISHKEQQFKQTQGGDVGSLSPEEIEGLKVGKGSFNGMTGDELMQSKVGKGSGVSGMGEAMPAPPMGAPAPGPALGASAPTGGAGAPGAVASMLQSQSGGGRYGGFMGGQGGQGALGSGLTDIIQGYMNKKKPGMGV